MRFLTVGLLLFLFACEEAPRCSLPYELKMNRISDNELMLRWKDDCREVSHYNIERRSNKKFELVAQISNAARVYLDNTVELDSQNYEYRVVSYCKVDKLGSSNKIQTLRYGYDISDQPYPYISYPPKRTNEEQGKYPLLIFLHGAGERGDDLELVKKHGPPMLAEMGKAFPCMIVAPQCPMDYYWSLDRLNLTLNDILEHYPIDRDRIYLTGISMGGFGTWAWAMDRPELFAAIVPICGGGNTNNAEAITEIPTWAFHGAKDLVVPVSRSKVMIETLESLGGKPQLTIYPEADHECWTQTYENKALYGWLFEQSR